MKSKEEIHCIVLQYKSLVIPHCGSYVQFYNDCGRTSKKVHLGSRHGQKAWEALERIHQIKHDIQKKEEQWPYPPFNCTRNKEQQMKTAVINLIKGNTMFVTNVLKSPLRDGLDMHEQVQNSNEDEITKARCIKRSDNMFTTFGRSLLGK